MALVPGLRGHRGEPDGLRLSASDSLAADRSTVQVTRISRLGRGRGPGLRVRLRVSQSHSASGRGHLSGGPGDATSSAGPGCWQTVAVTPGPTPLSVGGPGRLGVRSQAGPAGGPAADSAAAAAAALASPLRARVRP